jgi:regulation of enolase protein 1 (concanavalin A-like superfamily)
LLVDTSEHTTDAGAWQTATVTDLHLPGVPFPLEQSGSPECTASLAGEVLTLSCGAGSDLFIDPGGDEASRPDAGRWTGLPGEDDFTLAARVTVAFGAGFDAGALLLYLSERRWAKLCYELSPQGRPTAVTVVTHGTSDDSNSFETAGGPLWLRLTRSRRSWAFHASSDGRYWQLLRYFTLGETSGARVGFLAQSPRGPGCSAVFDSVRYTPGAPDNLRDGS